MKRKLNFLIALFVWLYLPVQSFSKNKLESWYTYWGIGVVDVSYPGEIEDLLDILKDMPGVSQTAIGLDLFGFYWPRGNKDILGFIINGWGDRYESRYDHIQMNGYLYSFSWMHFVNHDIGQGFFIRGDFGLSRLVLDSSFESKLTASDWGFGLLAGVGYGIPVSDETRLLINLNYSFRRVEAETYGALQLSIGGLF